MSKRYVIDPDDTWHNVGSDLLRADSPVTVELRDVVERSDNGVVIGRWRSGAYRVTAPGKRTKVFIGETAWSDADRLAYDWDIEIQRAAHARH